MLAVLTRASLIARQTRCISQPTPSRRRRRMKHSFSFAAGIAHWIERAACAARIRGKMGEGKISTEAIASILGLPGEPIFSETGVGGVGPRISPAAVENSFTAVQHLTKPLFLSKRVEPPLRTRTFGVGLNPWHACP